MTPGDDATDYGVAHYFGMELVEHYQADGFLLTIVSDATALEMQPGDFTVKRTWSTAVMPYVERVIPGEPVG